MRSDSINVLYNEEISCHIQPVQPLNRTISRSSVVQLVQMRALPATSPQVHRLRVRYSTVCSTHVTGTAVQVQTQPAAVAAADPTAVVSQILDLTADTGAHLSTMLLFGCVLSRYRCQAPNVMHRVAYVTEQCQPGRALNCSPIRPLRPLHQHEHNLNFCSAATARCRDAVVLLRALSPPQMEALTCSSSSVSRWTAC